MSRFSMFLALPLLFAAFSCGGTDFDAGESYVEVVNESDWDIVEFYLSPSDSRSWGEELLDGFELWPGESLELEGIPCDTYDVQVVDEDGDVCIVTEIDLCGDAESWVIDNDFLLNCIDMTAWEAMAGMMDDDHDMGESYLTLVNESDWSIDELYFTYSDDEEWGDDLLGAYILEPGDEVDLDDIPCDTYDIMLVAEGGEECILEAVDFCYDDEEWVITSEDLLVCVMES